MIKIEGVSKERSKEIIQKFKLNEKAYEWIKYLIQLPVVIELQEKHVQASYINPTDVFIQFIAYKNHSWLSINAYGKQGIGDGLSTFNHYLYYKRKMLPIDEEGYRYDPRIK